MGKILSRLQNQKTTMDVVDKLLVNQTLLGAFKITKPFESSRVETTSFNARKCLIDGNLRPEYSTSSSTNLCSWRVRILRFLGFRCWLRKIMPNSKYILFWVCVRHHQWRVDSSCGFLVPTLAASMLWPLMQSNHPTKGRVLEKFSV